MACASAGLMDGGNYSGRKPFFVAPGPRAGRTSVGALIWSRCFYGSSPGTGTGRYEEGAGVAAGATKLESLRGPLRGAPLRRGYENLKPTQLRFRGRALF